ncbi:MAG: hypothetical protein NZ530_01480 [Thermodesulfobacteriaceae bacterium]|nr:hypothetical protein [Thermodesulfobacteriaceae bacterium]MCX8041179.1 hypothetical protein [Thermodesulfobacteriaceae bacterium]MDW8135183.1 hypothetical protein [Thermodesulfobacterium sp.]
MKKNRKSKYGISRSSFFISPNLTKEAKRLKRLNFIRETSCQQEVLSKPKVIEFHDKYGTEATKAALGVSKTTIYRRKNLKR